MMRLLPGRSAFVAALALLALACSDFLVPPAPSPAPSLALSLASAGGADEAFDRADRVRVRLLEGEASALDTTLALTPTGDVTRLSLPVDEVWGGKSLVLLVELGLADAPLFRGSVPVVLQGAATTVEVPLEPVVAGIRLPPGPELTALGEGPELDGAALFATGDTVPGLELSWRSLDPDVVDVGPSGRLDADREGEARVEGSHGPFADTLVVRVRPVAARVVVSPASVTLAVGESVLLSAAVLDSNDNELEGREVSWRSSQPDLAPVDAASGEVSALRTGMVTVTATHGEVSGEATVTLENPAPTLSGTRPEAVVVSGEGLTLTVLGEGFVEDSQVRWNGEGRSTEFVGPTELRASIPASDLESPGAVTISVVSPPPGGGTSGGLTLTVGNPAPVLDDISPDDAVRGASSLELSLEGSGFVPTSVVRWNGTALPTRFVGGSRLTATVAEPYLESTGSASVTVMNPEPGGGVSEAQTFRVRSPASIALSETGVAFEAASGAELPAPRTVTITNDGSAPLTGLSASVSYASEAGWLSVGLDGTRAPATLSIAPTTTELPAGTYAATVTVSSDAPRTGDRTLSVQYVVTESPSIELSATEVSFRAVAGLDSPEPQEVDVTNGGSGTLSALSATVGYGPEEPTGWLTATLSSTLGPTTLTLEADPAGSELEPGTYHATVLVASQTADNSPQEVSVTLQLDGYSHWQAEGDFFDSGSAGNHGTPSGTVDFANGFVGQAFRFLGPFSPGEVTAPDNGGIATADAVTLAAWVNLDLDEPGNDIRRFVSLSPDRAVLRLDGRGEQADFSLHFYVRTDRGPLGIYADGWLQAGCWQHVAATYDGATLRLYYNGEEVEAAEHVGSLNDGNNEIKLSNQDGTETLEGLLDEVRVYPRAASAAEIAELAGMNGGGTCSGEL